MPRDGQKKKALRRGCTRFARHLNRTRGSAFVIFHRRAADDNYTKRFTTRCRRRRPEGDGGVGDVQRTAYGAVAKEIVYVPI